MSYDDERGSLFWILVSGGAALFVILLIGAALYGCPKWGVYSRRMDGRATLEQQQYARRVAIEEAKAKKESASLLAEAEIERAKGVAKANKIIGDSLQNNEGYLRYLWIQGLQDGSSEVIYIPTEANLPLWGSRDRPGTAEADK